MTALPGIGVRNSSSEQSKQVRWQPAATRRHADRAAPRMTARRCPHSARSTRPRRVTVRSIPGFAFLSIEILRLDKGPSTPVLSPELLPYADERPPSTDSPRLTARRTQAPAPRTADKTSSSNLPLWYRVAPQDRAGIAHPSAFLGGHAQSPADVLDRIVPWRSPAAILPQRPAANAPVSNDVARRYRAPRRASRWRHPNIGTANHDGWRCRCTRTG